jgi:hypothetical protein
MSHLFSSFRRHKSIYLVLSLLTIALIADSSFFRIYSINTISLDIQPIRYLFFLTVACIVVSVQYPIMNFVKTNTKELGTESKQGMRNLHKIVTIVQYCLSSLFVLVIAEVSVFKYYGLAEVLAIVSISYSFATMMMVFLAKKFISWYILNKNGLILTYGISALIVAINLTIAVLFVGEVLITMPQYVPEHTGILTTPFVAAGSFSSFLNYVFTLSTIVSFSLMWVSTMVLLRHYSRQFGPVKLYLILIIPLVYFLIQFLPSFPEFLSALFGSNITFSYYIYYVVFTFSKPIGAALFGLAFWTISSRLKHGSVIKKYVNLAAYGLVALFISNQAILLIFIPYPPFGLPSVAFLGLGSYLLFVGLYSSAIIVARNTEIRNSVRTKATELLDAMGSTQMESEIVSTVDRINRTIEDNAANEIDLESSLNEDEIRQYTNWVIEQVKSRKEEE